MEFDPLSLHQQKFLRVVGKIMSNSKQLVPVGRIFLLTGEGPYNPYDGGRNVSFSGFTVWCADSEPSVFESLQKVDKWSGDIDFFKDFKLGGPTVIINLGVDGHKSMSEYFSKFQGDFLNPLDLLNLSEWCSDFAVKLNCDPDSLGTNVKTGATELTVSFSNSDFRSVSDFLTSINETPDQARCMKIATEKMRIILSWREYPPGYWCLHGDALN